MKQVLRVCFRLQQGCALLAESHDGHTVHRGLSLASLAVRLDLERPASGFQFANDSSRSCMIIRSSCPTESPGRVEASLQLPCRSTRARAVSQKSGSELRA